MVYVTLKAKGHLSLLVEEEEREELKEIKIAEAQLQDQHGNPIEVKKRFSFIPSKLQHIREDAKNQHPIQLLAFKLVKSNTNFNSQSVWTNSHKQ